MNHTKIILTTLVIIIISTLILLGIRMSVPTTQYPELTLEIGDEITSTTQEYVSETGDEATVAYHSDDTATLDLIGSEYMQIQFTRATSASGVRYENTEKSLVLWEKAPEVSVYKDDRPIFQGSVDSWTTKEFLFEQLTSYTWIWKQTRIGSDFKNPDSVISSDDSDRFTITFSPDGKISGTTDCNNFSGSYSIDNQQIKFGSLMSTLMYCENSKEQEFLKMLSDGEISLTRGSGGQGEPYFYKLTLLNNNGTQVLFFEKK